MDYVASEMGVRVYEKFKDGEHLTGVLNFNRVAHVMDTQIEYTIQNILEVLMDAGIPVVLTNYETRLERRGVLERVTTPTRWHLTPRWEREYVLVPRPEFSPVRFKCKNVVSINGGPVTFYVEISDRGRAKIIPEQGGDD